MTEPYYSDDTVTLLHGNALALAGTLAPLSVQTIVTSPPYFGLRDYGNPEQFGAEESVEEFIEHLVDLFAALRPALADDGTLWLNLGDSYASEPGWGRGGGSTLEGTQHSAPGRSGKSAKQFDSKTRPRSVLPPKNLIGVPWRVALALQADGWILRSDIIWAKPNPMPESVTDRPTKSHEYLFLLAKSSHHYYDADAIKETSTSDHPAGNVNHKYTDQYEAEKGTNQQHRTKAGLKRLAGVEGTTRNKRTVWAIPTQPFAGAHFAVYPPELIRPCILAGSRVGATVLDPFSGSGTTGMVATQEGRKYIGIDLNSDYLDLSLKTRFLQPTLSIGDIA